MYCIVIHVDQYMFQNFYMKVGVCVCQVWPVYRYSNVLRLKFWMKANFNTEANEI